MADKKKNNTQAQKVDKERVQRQRSICSPRNLFLATFVVFIGCLVALTLSPYQPIYYKLPPPPKFEGPLAVNNLLQNAELLLKGQVIGPESIIVEGNTLYTGTTDGKIVKIVNGVITKTVLLSDHKDCQTLESRLQNLHICGRPLGMRRKDKDTIIVADCYLGILSVDVEKGTKKVLLPGGTIIEGKPLLFADDFDFINEDTIVFSD
uniref:Adipocyte plasma membrane-associated protein n=1 Tax=Acrobeloides nanus TaxID=290746 RepID=A0A914E5I0_9BILA